MKFNLVHRHLASEEKGLMMLEINLEASQQPGNRTTAILIIDKHQETVKDQATYQTKEETLTA